jgi:alpha-1,3-mannosyl-glycoprotein beta-1,2-N-acetylglucosaminyltransferase
MGWVLFIVVYLFAACFESVAVRAPAPGLVHKDARNLPNSRIYKLDLLIIACNRPSVSRALNKIEEYRPLDSQLGFRVTISQDCNGDTPTKQAIQPFLNNHTFYMAHPYSNHKNPPYDKDGVVVKKKHLFGYYFLSTHFKWALDRVFGFSDEAPVSGRVPDALILLEDDLEIAPDFFEYFTATLPLLLKDPTLMCVSAWNDNGISGLVDPKRHDLLYRSDFFPGLGWMLTRDFWQELRLKWPIAYWDDWLREPENRLDRSCIRPELSRTYTFGKDGVSKGEFWKTYLSKMVLNDQYYHFTKFDLSYLEPAEFFKLFTEEVYQNATLVTKPEQVQANHPQAYRFEVESKKQWETLCKALGPMSERKAGVPRAGYHGIVSIMYKGSRVYLAPKLPFKGYTNLYP